jgi:hypothetical protein
MVPASSRKATCLAVAGLLLAGLFGLIQLAPAQTKDKDKKADKDKEAKTTTPKAPAKLVPLKMVIASKDADVAEMKKVIDEKIAKGWEENKVAPTGYCDDYEFLRRASLDLVGRIAKPEEIDRYLKDPPERRRSELIERLLKHEDYARHWANLWSNWLLTRSGDFGRGKYHEQMQVWLEDQFAQNKKYDEIARALLTAKGKNSDNGAVNFILAHLGESVKVTNENGRPDPQKTRERIQEEGQWEMIPLTSRITRVFMGTQTQCAQCHDHPFAQSLKQKMFWGVNAFLRQVKRTPGPGGRQRMMALQDLTLSDDESVNVDATAFYETRGGKFKQQKAEFLPAAGKDSGPRMDAKEKKVGIARREALADYLVEHEMFSKAMVNRFWGLFMGRGFVNPIDDFNDNNQPSNPELLDELAARFKHYNYDMKKLIRWITHSNAYHLSHVANTTNDKVEHENLFSRMILKALSPEQMFESLMIATKAEQAEAPAAKKTLRDRWLGALINNFGDDEGNEVNFNGTIVQALMMMNGKEINDAIARDKKGAVAIAIAGGKTRAEVITKLYLTALNRRPTAGELRSVQAKMALIDPKQAKKDTAKAMYEDLFWALLNSNEFILNH